MQEIPFDELDDLYQEVILDHYRNPRNKGELESPDLQSRGFNPFCGDEVILNLKLDTQGIIREAAFTGQGCSISQAASSILTELVKGNNLEEAGALSDLFRGLMRGEIPFDEELERMGDLEALQGVRQFPIRIKCALLAWATLDDAVVEYRTRTSQA